MQCILLLNVAREQGVRTAPGFSFLGLLCESRVGGVGEVGGPFEGPSLPPRWSHVALGSELGEND